MNSSDDSNGTRHLARYNEEDDEEGLECRQTRAREPGVRHTVVTSPPHGYSGGALLDRKEMRHRGLRSSPPRGLPPGDDREPDHRLAGGQYRSRRPPSPTWPAPTSQATCGGWPELPRPLLDGARPPERDALLLDCWSSQFHPAGRRPRLPVRRGLGLEVRRALRDESTTTVRERPDGQPDVDLYDLARDPTESRNLSHLSAASYPTSATTPPTSPPASPTSPRRLAALRSR
jgi:hypothetical protein